MRAVAIQDMGPNSRLVFVDRPDPAPAHDELLVRVVATAANRADLMQRTGHYPAPPGESEILGLEMAGEVVATGKACQRFDVGDVVCSLLAGGGFAQYVIIPEVLAMAVPAGLDTIEAAALPEVFMTAWQTLVWQAQLQAGETALVHAGASGVGTAAIQIAKNLLEARVLVTASTSKHELCLSLGACAAIDYRAESFAERVGELSGGRGANVIVDFMGASYLDANIRAAAQDGRIVTLALMGGAAAERVNLGLFFRKRLKLQASTLRNRPLEHKTQLARDFETHLTPAFAERRLRPVIDRILPWTKVEEAHDLLARNETRGKVVLVVDPDGA
ncbi:MAG: NAD(P)H-quinone oxidoreductase [Pseudomonadota bacterium]